MRAETEEWARAAHKLVNDKDLNPGAIAWHMGVAVGYLARRDNEIEELNKKACGLDKTAIVDFCSRILENYDHNPTYCKNQLRATIEFFQEPA